jgi:hydrogenase-4 component F
MLLLIPLLLPLLGAVVVLFFRGAARAALLIGAAEIAALAWLMLATYRRGSISYGRYLRADNLTTVFLAGLCLIFALVLAYSSGYLRHLPSERFASLRWFYALLFLFLFTMLAAYLSSNLGLLWIFMEGTTLASALLVGFYETEGAVEAGWKYLVVCTVGLAFALFGTIALYLAAVKSGVSGSSALDWTSLVAAAPQLSLMTHLVKLAFLFLMVGYGTKVGFVPLHSWLPDAHAEAPSPISTMLSATLLNCAIYALLRFDAISVRALGAGFSHHLFLLFGGASILIAGLLMIVQRDLKRLFAYSSVEHMGIIATGIGLGGPLGLYGALLHTFNHSVGKSVLFFAAGNVRENLGTLRIDRITGMTRVLPFTSGALVLGGLAIVGMPPFALFVSEFAILSAAFSQAQHLVAVIFLVGLTLAFGALLFHFLRMLGGEPTGTPGSRRVARAEVAVIATCALVLLVFGLHVPALFRTLLEGAVGALQR